MLTKPKTALKRSLAKPLGLIDMRHINYILIFLFLVGCSSTKKMTKNNSKPTKFVFKKSMVSTQNGISTLKSKQDSLMNKELMEIQTTDFLTQTPETEIHIEIQNDSIWRYAKQKGKMIGNYFMIQKNIGTLNYYDKSKSVNYRTYDLFAQNHEYEISENREDRKQIKGFNCFKLTLVKIDKQSDLGNTIYEMYVTEKIALPLHSVINLTKLVPNTFPMEIKVSEENLSGMTELYELKTVE